MIKDLIKLSQNLKALGHIKQANVIEGVITKVHGKGPEEPVEADDQAVCVHCDESHHMDDDHQCAEESGSKHSDSYMAKPQLNKIQEYAKKLHDELKDGEQLDDWMESHIAKMDQMIGDVYHKYSYKNKKELMENPSLVIANRKKELNNLFKSAGMSNEYLIVDKNNSLEVTTSNGTNHTIKILEVDTGWYGDTARGGFVYSIDGEEHEWEFHSGFYADGATWRIIEKLGEDNNSDEPTDLEEKIEGFIESQVKRNPKFNPEDVYEY